MAAPQTIAAHHCGNESFDASMKTVQVLESTLFFKLNPALTAISGFAGRQSYNLIYPGIDLIVCAVKTPADNEPPGSLIVLLLVSIRIPCKLLSVMLFLIIES